MKLTSADPETPAPRDPARSSTMRHTARNRLFGWAVALVSAACSGALPELPEPVAVLDMERAKQAEELVTQMRCAGCHPSQSQRTTAETAPLLDRIGARKTPSGLRRWLSNPHAVKPGTAMPDMFAGLESDERERVIEDLVHFLAAQGFVFEAWPPIVDLVEVERGRQLFHSVGCVACHDPHESAEDLERPLWSFPRDEMFVSASTADLAHLTFDTTVTGLTQFLMDPLAARPSGRMPSMHLTLDEATDIALYLLRGQSGDRGLAVQPGLRWVSYQGRFETCEPGFRDALPTGFGVALSLDELPAHDLDRFGLEFRGFLEVEHTGTHTFYAHSDDGSRIYVDGRLVVDNDGDHAPSERSGEVWLARGKHSLTVTFYENEGGEELAVRWKPPEGEKESIPSEALTHVRVSYPALDVEFELDARRVEHGRVAFETFGCSSCHAIEGREPRAPAQRPLASLSERRTRGCLGDAPHPNAPCFALDPSSRDLLRAWIAHPNAANEPRDEHANLHATMKRLDCFACHTRDGEGGPNADRAAYFRPSREVDLGNEGRLPPKLDDVGEKLREEWIERVLNERMIARPYLATRMPSFGAQNVMGLAAAFTHVDLPTELEPEPEFDATQIDAGRRLAGNKGLGCIQCHMFNGVDSLGIPAVDLAHVHERIRSDWFARLILDPKSVGMNSRMPELWETIPTASGPLVRSPVTDLFDGDPRRQVTALWQYLSLGTSMPLPEGLNAPESEYELVPIDEPILCAAFLAGHTPRGMMVGHPEFVHFAFDLEHARPVWAWRGRFFNAQSTWHGRAGGLVRPPSDDVHEFAGHCAVRSEDVATPRPLGWRLDEHRRPVFVYRLNDVRIEESFEPRPRPYGSSLLRKIVAIDSNDTRDAKLFVDLGAGPNELVFSREANVWVARVEAEVIW